MNKQLVLRNIFGRKSIVLDTNKDVEKITSTSGTGKLGKIYYNTTDNKYYIYDGTNFKELGSSAIQNVEELPSASNAEEGKIYYNTTDGKYYVYDSIDGYTNISTGSTIPIVTLTEPNGNISGEGVEPAFDTYEIEPNKYYILPIITHSLTQLDTNVIDNVIKFVNFVGGTETNQYFGRFTVGAANVNLAFRTDNNDYTVHLSDADSDIELEEGHTYEFNVLVDNVCIKDITWTDPNATNNSEASS